MGLVDRSPWSPLVGTMKIDTSLLPTRQEHEKGRFTHFSHSSVPLVNPVGSIRDCSPGGEKNCFLPPHLGVNPAIFKVPLGPSLPTDFSHSPVPLVSPCPCREREIAGTYYAQHFWTFFLSRRFTSESRGIYHSTVPLVRRERAQTAKLVRTSVFRRNWISLSISSPEGCVPSLSLALHQAGTRERLPGGTSRQIPALVLPGLM